MLEPPPDKSPLRIQHHYIYICAWVLVGSLVLYIPGGLTGIDALLLASGAATQTGLNPVDLNRLHVVQQGVLWLVSMVTNIIFMNSLLVSVRLYWFRKRFRGAITDAKETWRSQRRSQKQALRQPPAETLELSRSASDAQWESNGELGEQQPLLDRRVSGDKRAYDSLKDDACDKDDGPSSSPHITWFEPDIQARTGLRRQSYSSSVFSAQSTDYGTETIPSMNEMPTLPSLMWQQSIASYSDWDEPQKEELGGIEYRALKTLMIILACYYIGFHLLGMVVCLVWAVLNPRYEHALDEKGIAHIWWALFTASSAFNDLGYTLTPDSMGLFWAAPLPLLVMTALIVMGNTGFPCVLRMTIWALSKVTRQGTPLQQELDFLLRHPRRCFTLLFPRAETWKLVGVLLLLNTFDLVIFCALQEVTPPNLQLPRATITHIINGLFQIVSTRTAGFSISPLSDLHPAIQVSFIVMMYISAFPIAIALRKTNIYEEKSLGIYPDSDYDYGVPFAVNRATKQSNLIAHIQHQLGFDLWYVILGFFLLALTEGSRIAKYSDDDSFSLYAVLFEIVSAYGTVGLSLGYPRTETSLCAQFSPAGKLVVIAMQVRGRHRGLPSALDHAILLPCDSEREAGGEEWWWRRWLRARKRRRSSLGSLFLSESGYRLVD